MPDIMKITYAVITFFICLFGVVLMDPLINTLIGIAPDTISGILMQLFKYFVYTILILLIPLLELSDESDRIKLMERVTGRA